MKIQIENTDKTVIVDGIEMRIWEGASEAGVPVVALIARIAVPEDQPAESLQVFKAELKQCRKPSRLVDRTFDGRLAL